MDVKTIYPYISATTVSWPIYEDITWHVTSIPLIDIKHEACWTMTICSSLVEIESKPKKYGWFMIYHVTCDVIPFTDNKLKAGGSMCLCFFLTDIKAKFFKISSIVWGSCVWHTKCHKLKSVSGRTENTAAKSRIHTVGSYGSPCN